MHLRHSLYWTYAALEWRRRAATAVAESHGRARPDPYVGVATCGGGLLLERSSNLGQHGLESQGSDGRHWSYRGHRKVR